MTVTTRATWPEYTVDLGRDLERVQIDQKAAEESLCRYCKPVELYNIIQRRALVQPNFLQRNLHYKIKTARQKRIKLRVAALEPTDAFENGLRFFVMVTTAADKDAFRFSLTRLLSHSEDATFLLPEIRKLDMKVRRDDHFIVFVSLANPNGDAETSLVGYKGHVYWGKLSLSTFCDAWLEQSRSNAATAMELSFQCDISVQRSIFQHENLVEGKCMRFTSLCDGVTNLTSIKIQVSGEEAGIISNVPKPDSSCAQLRCYGRVYFHYLYFFDKLKKIEVTEKFSCPFCLVSCGSFTGLKCHLDACHDLFKFEFLATEDTHSVIVSCRNDIEGDNRDMDSLSDPRLKSFTYCSNSCSVRRRKIPRLPKGQTQSRHNLSYLQKTDSGVSSSGQNFKQMVSVNLIDGLEKPQQDLMARNEYMKMTLSSRRFPLPLPKKRRLETAADFQSFYPEKGSGSVIRAAVPRNRTGLLAATNKLVNNRVKKDRSKVSSERAEARNRALLQKRLFFHSHTAQPMEIEQLHSDKDSEDELDDTVAGLEDRRMLNDFVDVGKEEKDLMHRWNSFVRRQKIVADGHCPWAVEMFARMHAKDLKAQTMRRSFMLMLVKFWNHHLIDGSVVDRCLSIVDT